MPSHLVSHERTGPRGRWGAAAGLLSSALVCAVLVSSCASLIGLEKRTLEDGVGGMGGQMPMAGMTDPETDLETRQQCIEYCDVVMENCVDENAVYTGRSACIKTCNLLPAGSELEPPFGNTVVCRLDRAKSAGDAEPSLYCPAAGPGGESSDENVACGSNCEAWCGLGRQVCSDEFEPLSDCESVCQSIPSTGDYDLEASYSSDNIQCRLIHIAAALEDPETHCSHTKLQPTEFCDGDLEPVDCRFYCRTIMATCQEKIAVYENEDQCLAVCDALRPGMASDQNQNTVGCRTYHALAAAKSEAAVHCPHAGPGGDAQCGKDASGPCASYCRLASEGCPSAAENVWVNPDDCLSECVAEYSAEAAGMGTYTSADPQGPFYCRMRAAARALTAAAAGETAQQAAACNQIFGLNSSCDN